MIPIRSKSLKNLKIIYQTIKSGTEPQSAETYVKTKLEKLGVKVTKQKYRGKDKGRPDYKCSYKRHIFYVEVKNGSDVLRANQIKWIADNPRKFVYIYCIKQNLTGNYWTYIK